MIPSSLTPLLASSANSAVQSVLQNGAMNFGQTPPSGEVGYVAATVLGGVPGIATAWQPILKPAGYSVRMTGGFCHQTPMVDFTWSGASRRCELADLLVVVDDLTSGSPGKRWAVLIQAKMANAGGGTTLTKSGDLVQFDLLSNWPPFTMPTTFSPGPRDFSTCAHRGVPMDCGRYGLIDNQPIPPVWYQQAPATTMPRGGTELGTFLANMIEHGQKGYGREATGVADDWSRTVDELLKISAGLAFTYSAGFKGTRPRQNSAVAFVSHSLDDWPFLWQSWADQVPPSGERPTRDREGSPAEGLSFIHIGVGRSVDPES